MITKGTEEYKCKQCNFKGSIDEVNAHFTDIHSNLMYEKVKDLSSYSVRDPTQSIQNKNGHLSWIGEMNKYYCGRDLDIKCNCPCKGCGPNDGDNCTACMKLDIETRNLPPGWLVNKKGFNAIIIEGALYCGVNLG